MERAHDQVVAEWKHGAWRLSAPGTSLGGIRSLADVQSAVATSVGGEDDGDRLRIVLPASVQRLIDEAAALDAAGLGAAADAARGGAARLLRSKRMRDDDIARCLAVPVAAVRLHLPQLPR